MKKIGILTYHHTTNFGATLQAYSLQKFIQSLGHSVEFIDYRPKVARDFYSRTSSEKQLEIYNTFLKQNLNLSQEQFMEEDELEVGHFDYDIVISGSDQIWHMFSYRGVDSSFFLNFIPDEVKKISYAASFGDSKLEYFEKVGDDLRELLSRYSNILVRDLNSKYIVDSVLNHQRSEIVLDPVFISEFDSELQLLEQSEINTYNDAILVYGQFNETQINLIKQYARSNSKKVCALTFKYDFADYNLSEVSPFETLHLFKNADAVFTNQYHGLLFSIKLQKRFYLFFSKDKINKLNDIIQRYDVRLADENNFDFEKSSNAGTNKDKFMLDIDYSRNLLKKLINED